MQGVQGAIYQMLNHGITTGALFLIVGMLSDRRHTRQIAEYGGLKHVTPKLVAAFLLITLSSIALPGMNGFIGEFLTLMGAYRWRPELAAVAATGVILSAVYMLWMFQRVNYGPLTNPKNKDLHDLEPREWAALGPTLVMAVVMGVAPNFFLAPMAPSVDRLVQRLHAQRPAVRQGLPAGKPCAGGTRPCPLTTPRPLPATVDHDFGAGSPMMTDLQAIMPILIVTLTAIVTMVAESFQPKGERVPLGGLGLIGLDRRRGRVRAAVGTRRSPASASCAPTTSRSSST